MGVTKEQESQIDFPIMHTDITKKNGSLKCKAVDCMKNRQAGAGCFCRVHYNKFLISTGGCARLMQIFHYPTNVDNLALGQVESWECKCGNKVRITEFSIFNHYRISRDVTHSLSCRSARTV